MNVGILTAGGVCPGVNNIVRTLTLYENSVGSRVLGFNEGFRGLNHNFRTDLTRQKVEDTPGSILRVSCDPINIQESRRALSELDRLYCICGNESMTSATKLALSDLVETNIIGIAKTIFNDLPGGLEAVGFQTAVQEFAKYIDYAYTEASTTNSVVFLETPGNKESNLSTHAMYARYSKVTDTINHKTNMKHCMSQIKNNCDTNGFAVVVVAEACDYKDVIKYLKKWTKNEVKVMSPGFVIRDTQACVYDSILSVKVAKEAFMDAQKMRNFVRGGNTRILFEDYAEFL
jgi:6-phosphofructokinase 1